MRGLAALAFCALLFGVGFHHDDDRLREIGVLLQNEQHAGSMGSSRE